MGAVIVITSGKGGTGKTTITGGAAAALSRVGRHTTICNSSSRGSDVIFWPPQMLHIHGEQTHRQGGKRFLSNS